MSVDFCAQGILKNIGLTSTFDEAVLPHPETNRHRPMESGAMPAWWVGWGRFMASRQPFHSLAQAQSA
jgi:hypothetical protein